MYLRWSCRTNLLNEINFTNGQGRSYCYWKSAQAAEGVVRPGKQRRPSLRKNVWGDRSSGAAEERNHFMYHRSSVVSPLELG